MCVRERHHLEINKERAEAAKEANINGFASYSLVSKHEGREGHSTAHTPCLYTSIAPVRPQGKRLCNGWYGRGCRCDTSLIRRPDVPNCPHTQCRAPHPMHPPHPCQLIPLTSTLPLSVCGGWEVCVEGGGTRERAW